MISIPTYDGTVLFQSAQAAFYASRNMQRHAVQHVQNSALPKCFNLLWLGALKFREKGITHFAMLHADIIPEDYWLDKMLAIAAEKKADVLSVVIPMKSGHGLVSTGIDSDDPFHVPRFTLAQIHAGPETFTHPRLVVNTGLMLVDLRKQWAEKIAFKFQDSISNGEAINIPEDYDFSRQVRALGGSVWATRAVKADHVGRSIYTNAEPWGSLKTDTYHGEAVL